MNNANMIFSRLQSMYDEFNYLTRNEEKEKDLDELKKRKIINEISQKALKIQTEVKDVLTHPEKINNSDFILLSQIELLSGELVSESKRFLELFDHATQYCYVPVPKDSQIVDNRVFHAKNKESTDRILQIFPNFIKKIISIIQKKWALYIFRGFASNERGKNLKIRMNNWSLRKKVLEDKLSAIEIKKINLRNIIEASKDLDQITSVVKHLKNLDVKFNSIQSDLNP